ncbi:MAG: ABC transporter ATP-binding protein [Clostridia bacterium]|nr:ABC transporter ATP-binding protein [Clostridia bacterium]
MSFISLVNVSRIFGNNENRTVALSGVSFSAEKGEFVVILGASGAGKTTLLNIIGGMDVASEGKYTVNGEDITALDSAGLTTFRRDKVGFVFQFYNLMPNLTAIENVELACAHAKERIPAREALSAVGLAHRFNHFPSTLSGGEQQRVSIARAIAKKPEILLCDEPTGALDSMTGKNILSVLKNLSREGERCVLIVTHNANIAQMADRVIRLSDGKIISDEVNPSPKDVEEIEW